MENVLNVSPIQLKTKSHGEHRRQPKTKDDEH